MKRMLDDKGRIIAPAERDYQGHSVCNHCGKDMPVCWDAVCSRCNFTFCKKCIVIVKQHKKVCKDCATWPERIRFLLSYIRRL